MDERVTLNMKDIKRLYVIQQVDERKMTARAMTRIARYLGFVILPKAQYNKGWYAAPPGEIKPETGAARFPSFLSHACKSEYL